MKHKLFHQTKEEEFKYLLFRQTVEINLQKDIINSYNYYINLYKYKLSRNSYKFKNSYKKEFYLKFSLKELIVYRENLCFERMYYNELLENTKLKVKTLYNNLNLMLNNLVNNELLLNKFI